MDDDNSLDVSRCFSDAAPPERLTLQGAIEFIRGSESVTNGCVLQPAFELGMKVDLDHNAAKVLDAPAGRLKNWLELSRHQDTETAVVNILLTLIGHFPVGNAHVHVFDASIDQIRFYLSPGNTADLEAAAFVENGELVLSFKLPD